MHLISAMLSSASIPENVDFPRKLFLLHIPTRKNCMAINQGALEARVDHYEARGPIIWPGQFYCNDERMACQ